MLALPDGTVALSYTQYHSGYRDIEVRHIDPSNNVTNPGIANTDSTGDALGSEMVDLGTGPTSLPGSTRQTTRRTHRRVATANSFLTRAL